MDYNDVKRIVLEEVTIIVNMMLMKKIIFME